MNRIEFDQYSIRVHVDGNGAAWLNAEDLCEVQEMADPRRFRDWVIHEARPAMVDTYPKDVLDAVVSKLRAQTRPGPVG